MPHQGLVRGKLHTTIYIYIERERERNMLGLQKELLQSDVAHHNWVSQNLNLSHSQIKTYLNNWYGTLIIILKILGAANYLEF